MTWTIERPTIPGFYWFKGSAPAGQYLARDFALATIVEVTSVGPSFAAWFPHWQLAIPLSECEGQWVGPLEVPQ